MTGADELARFGRDLEATSKTFIQRLEPVMKRGAQNVKTDLAANVRASKHFKGFARSISYDRVEKSPTSIAYEIGPDKDRAGGALANIAFFGGANGGGGTVDLEGPLDREIPNLEREVLRLIEEVSR